MNRFFVEYKLHNRENGGWAYQVVKASDSFDECLKDYHSECAKYIGGTVFDHVCITIEDAMGNVLKSEVWDMPVVEEAVAEEAVTEEE